jgi:hypothetical protein
VFYFTLNSHVIFEKCRSISNWKFDRFNTQFILVREHDSISISILSIAKKNEYSYIMMNLQRMISIFQSILFLIIIIFACIYSIPIICIRRFHQHNHILTLNVCLATIFCSLSYLPVYAASIFVNPVDFSRKALIFFDIVQTIFTLQVPLSFVIASIHRYCSIVYHTKIFFKRKRWLVLCIGSQWMLGFILSIPNLIRIYTVRIFTH